MGGHQATGFLERGPQRSHGEHKEGRGGIGKTTERLTGTEASALYESLMGNAILLGFGLGRPGFKVQACPSRVVESWKQAKCPVIGDCCHKS